MWPFRKSGNRTTPAAYDLPSLPDSPLGREYGDVVRGIARLRGGDSSKVFGADSHQFQIKPPASEEEIAAFEAKHRIALPTDYRGFLAHVGNGGAGPYYGLFRLGEMDDGYDQAPWNDADGLVGVLAEPFPHTQAWNDLGGKPVLEEELEVRRESEDELFERHDEWERSHYWNARQVNGAIPICHAGCALRYWLVISGLEAGHVWYDRRVDEKGLEPVAGAAEPRVTFLQWYRSWLDDALRNT